MLCCRECSVSGTAWFPCVHVCFCMTEFDFLSLSDTDLYHFPSLSVLLFMYTFVFPCVQYFLVNLGVTGIFKMCHHLHFLCEGQWYILTVFTHEQAQRSPCECSVSRHTHTRPAFPPDAISHSVSINLTPTDEVWSLDAFCCQVLLPFNPDRTPTNSLFFLWFLPNIPHALPFFLQSALVFADSLSAL